VIFLLIIGPASMRSVELNLARRLNAGTDANLALLSRRRRLNNSSSNVAEVVE
jgi:hypothetical protein